MVCAIQGNFDDAQSGVKAIFTDRSLEEKFAEAPYGVFFGELHQLGRLVPQIVYYVSAYCDMVKSEKLKIGCADECSRADRQFRQYPCGVLCQADGRADRQTHLCFQRQQCLTDFLQSGTYDKNRPFYCTESPSMDILISSNLERLLFLLSGQDADMTRAYMEALSEKGCYKVSEKIFSALSDLFAAGCC